MRILKKIGFDDKLLQEIEKSAKINNQDLTKEINRLCRLGLNQSNNIEVNNSILLEIKDIKKIAISNYSLLKQMFANLDLENVDIKDSKSLNEYFRGKDNDLFQK